MSLLKKNNSDFIFKIAIFLLPFENFFFAPSSGWATLTPIVLFLYLLLNFNKIIDCIKKYKKIILFFAIGLIISFINYIFVGFRLINLINTLITLGLGFTILFSFDIYYSKNKSINSLINLVFISYLISFSFGLLEFLTIKFKINEIFSIFAFIFKRDYLSFNRVQYFFTEPSFIGMHLFGILLPLYFICKKKKILYLIILFSLSAVVFGSGVRILLDICIVGFILLIYYFISNKKYKYLIIMPFILILSFIFLYNNNYRFKQIANKGIYADGSLATRYFRIQSSIYGYLEKPIHVMFGYGLGNSLIPLSDGYDIAIKTYKSTYLDEVKGLGNSNFNDDAVSYCLYIRFVSEFGLFMLLIALIYIYIITKRSGFKYKYPYLIITLYLYVLFYSFLTSLILIIYL